MPIPIPIPCTTNYQPTNWLWWDGNYVGFLLQSITTAFMKPLLLSACLQLGSLLARGVGHVRKLKTGMITMNAQGACDG